MLDQRESRWKGKPKSWLPSVARSGSHKKSERQDALKLPTLGSKQSLQRKESDSMQQSLQQQMTGPALREVKLSEQSRAVTLLSYGKEFLSSEEHASRKAATFKSPGRLELPPLQATLKSDAVSYDELAQHPTVQLIDRILGHRPPHRPGEDAARDGNPTIQQSDTHKSEC